MALYMIATIRRTKDDIVGIRLYDTESRRIADRPINEVCSNMLNNLRIANLTIDKGELKGVNGSIDRYSIIPYGDSTSYNKPLVIIGKDNEAEYYLAVDYTGRNYEINKASIQQLNRPRLGVANGKIVNNRIFAIDGSYPEYRSSYTKRVQVKPKIYSFNQDDKIIFSKMVMAIQSMVSRDSQLLVGKPINKSTETYLCGLIPFNIRGRAKKNQPTIGIYLGYSRDVKNQSEIRYSSKLSLYVYIEDSLIYSSEAFMKHLANKTLTGDYIKNSLREILSCISKTMKSIKQ